MSATEELRRLLDERGVEWGANSTSRLLVTSWNDANGHSWAFTEYRDGSFSKLMAYHLNPEQAVAATLGPGTCKDATIEEHTQAFTCSECGCWVAYDEYWETGIYVEGEGQAVHIHPRYCPNCGRKVI